MWKGRSNSVSSVTCVPYIDVKSSCDRYNVVTHLQKHGLEPITEHVKTVGRYEDLMGTLEVLRLLSVIDMCTTRPISELCDAGGDVVINMKRDGALRNGLIPVMKNVKHGRACSAEYKTYVFASGR